MKLKTIDDVTGTPGGFKRFLKKKERFLAEREQDRKDRIRGKKPKSRRSKLSVAEQLALVS